MNVIKEPSWQTVLQEEFSKPYFTQLQSFVDAEYTEHTVYPPARLLYNAFEQCAFDKVKVVILGQDPYHGEGQAHGLSFSVLDGMKFPPSLVNIFKEIERDYNEPLPFSGNLERWAQQGVLLLNATLTVRAHSAGSHQGKGWEQFTDAVIAKLSQEREHIVFLLWGAYAQKKGAVIDASKHLVLEAVHPSPLSAYKGFIGCGHFSAANAYLKENGLSEIAW